MIPILGGISGDIVGYEISPPVMQYGSCYLHPIAWIGNDDTRTLTERYAVMLGAVETPIVVPYDVTPGRQRVSTSPREAGWFPIATSGVTYVARHLRRMVIRKRAGLAFDREWQRTHPDHAAERDRTIAYAEQCIAAWETGLRELEAEYGVGLATPEANLIAEEHEREVDEVPRSYAVMNDLLDYARAQQSLPSPDDVGSAFQRGLAHSSLGEYESAIGEYTEAIHLNPDDVATYNNRGVAYDTLGQHERAVTDFDAAIRLNSDEAQAYFSRGVAYCHLKQYAHALDDLTEAIRLAPNYPRAYHTRGLAHYHCTHLDQALVDLDEAIRLDAANAAIYYDRGIVHRDLSQDEQAITDFSETIRMMPDRANAYHSRGYAYYRLGDYERALADFDTAIRLNPADTAAVQNRDAARQALTDAEG